MRGREAWGLHEAVLDEAVNALQLDVLVVLPDALPDRAGTETERRVKGARRVCVE